MGDLIIKHHFIVMGCRDWNITSRGGPGFGPPLKLEVPFLGEIEIFPSLYSYLDALPYLSIIPPRFK